MKLLLNCANEKYRTAQQLNSQTGREIAGFDQVLSYSPANLPPDYARRHWKILWQRRGAGYWLWKPYFVLHTLQNMTDGDFLFYCDSGSYFVHPIDPLLKICEDGGHDVLTFGITFVEKHWTKRDAFLLLNADQPHITDTVQRLSGFILWRKSKAALELAQDWLRFAEDERAITDMPNQLGLTNYPGFQEHRHDQSVLSLLAKQRGLPAFRDPSQFGNGLIAEYPNSPFPQLIELTRAKTPMPLWHRVVREYKRWARSAASLWPAA